MRQTLRVARLKTKREAGELGSRTLLRLKRQAESRRFRGKLRREVGLDATRTNH